MSTTKTHLPAFQVFTYARDFLLAAQIIEQQAINGKTDLFSVASSPLVAGFGSIEDVFRASQSRE